MNILRQKQDKTFDLTWHGNIMSMFYWQGKNNDKSLANDALARNPMDYRTSLMPESKKCIRQTNRTIMNWNMNMLKLTKYNRLYEAGQMPEANIQIIIIINWMCWIVVLSINLNGQPVNQLHLSISADVSYLEHYFCYMHPKLRNICSGQAWWQYALNLINTKHSCTQFMNQVSVLGFTRQPCITMEESARSFHFHNSVISLFNITWQITRFTFKVILFRQL